MKPYVVTIQMNPLQQYFHMVLLIIENVVQTFESVDEILRCNIQMKRLQKYFHMVLII